LHQFGHLHRTEIGIGVQTITPTLAEALKLPRKYGVIVSDVLPGGPAEAAGMRIGDVLLAIDGKEAISLPYVASHLMFHEYGEKVHVEVLRENLRMAFDVPVMQPPRDADQVTSLADVDKNLVPALGILGVEINKKVAAMVPDLRDPFGIIVAARASGAGVEVPLNTGDVIRTLNGEPMTTLDRLRNALKALAPGAAAALQIQRDQKLMYIAFTLE
jgi:serine protease Do